MIGVYVGGRDENDDALMPSAQELRPAHGNGSARKSSKKKSKRSSEEVEVVDSAVKQLWSKLEIETEPLSGVHDSTDDQLKLKSKPAHVSSVEVTHAGVFEHQSEDSRAILTPVSPSIVNGKANFSSRVALSVIGTSETGNVPKVSPESFSSADPAIKREGTSLVETDIDKKSVTSPTKAIPRSLPSLDAFCSGVAPKTDSYRKEVLWKTTATTIGGKRRSLVECGKGLKRSSTWISSESLKSLKPQQPLKRREAVRSSRESTVPESFSSNEYIMFIQAFQYCVDRLNKLDTNQFEGLVRHVGSIAEKLEAGRKDKALAQYVVQMDTFMYKISAAMKPDIRDIQRFSR
ncbi:hypothetical protein CAEBREN_13819 [Caenorhabditis brenneri]|uniref:Uncharacterized protein n=1 Tax=Caenorhabditis brenneri TaxID=135651 RepID=G0NAZ9_CAEBE|nr:hypothetical protein CAEBREN_13819 [Caenorhabditis brenneri]